MQGLASCQITGLNSFIFTQVESPDGSSWMDSVQINNYEARPIAVSIHPKTGWYAYPGKHF